MGPACSKHKKKRQVCSSELIDSNDPTLPNSPSQCSPDDIQKLTFVTNYESPVKQKEKSPRSPTKHANKVSPLHVQSPDQTLVGSRNAVTPSAVLFKATARSLQATFRVQRMMSLRRSSLPDSLKQKSTLLDVPVYKRPRSSSVGAVIAPLTGRGSEKNKSVFGASRKVIEAKNKMMKKPASGNSNDRKSADQFARHEATLETGVFFLENDSVNYYQRLEELGSGSFGVVCKCFSTLHNTHFAMKIISKKRLIRKNRMLARGPGRPAPGGSRKDPLETLHREIAILKKMNHPNVVNLVEVIDDNQVDNVYMVFELMTGGTVIDIPTDKPLSEHQARIYFRDLLLGVEFLHFSKIIHRDIKPANLLLDVSGTLKIADFGVSDMFEGEDDFLHKFTGTPAFQAPEVLEHDTTEKFSGKAVDVWAMGVTLYCFVYGTVPFDAEALGDLHKAIKNDTVVFPVKPLVNPQLQVLVKGMMDKRTEDRLTITDIKEHIWVTNVGKEPLPSTEEHCTAVEVSEEDVRNSIKVISNISSVLLAKQILKGKSFAAAAKSLRVPSV